jgi:hypothetical protein
MKSLGGDGQPILHGVVGAEDKLSEEERQAIIKFVEMVQEYVNTIPKEESPEIYAAVLEMIRESRRS